MVFPLMTGNHLKLIMITLSQNSNAIFLYLQQFCCWLQDQKVEQAGI